MHFIFVRMGYESVSALTVLIIIVALMFGWLPKRTENSMKSMLEHSEDRYSPSLHIVDYSSDSLFHACSGTMAKGVGMQPSKMQANTKPNNGKSSRNSVNANKHKCAKQFNGVFTPEHVARIRALRRAAIRRRRALVLSLAFLTLVVFVAGLSGLYSAWFAIIPLAAVCTVLYFGSMAAKQARKWEAKVALYNKRSAAFNDSVVEPIFDAAVNSVVEHVENSDNSINPDNTETSVMQQRDISMALAGANRQEAAKSAVEDMTSEVSASTVAGDFSAANDVRSQADISNSNQDLISFSFGDDSSDCKINANDPQSLEIKSTKQVTKAIAAGDSNELAAAFDSSNPNSASDSTEVTVEPPVSTEDSLGKADLRDVLARRAA